VERQPGWPLLYHYGIVIHALSAAYLYGLYMYGKILIQHAFAVSPRERMVNSGMA